MVFVNMLGFWALMALIPFIILYLRKPRPQDRTIPSLMFLLRDQNESKRSQLLQKFMVNFLFFLQLLAFIVLAIALAKPMVTLPYDISLENTILVIDASASMQADESGSTRFEKAIDEAKKRLSGANSIILAEHIPITVLEDEGSDTATDVLSQLEPKATITNLGDAMLLAKDLLGERPGRIVVISDFSAINPDDLLVVKRTLSSQDLIVEFVDVSNNAENAGIVDMELRKHSIKVFVKNFNSVKKSVQLTLEKDGKTITQSNSFEIAPNSIETFLFDNVPGGQSKIVLLPNDDLSIDNEIFLSAPTKQTISILLITNKQNSHLEDALKASADISLNVVNPPVLTVAVDGKRIDTFAHDVIIVHGINNVGKRDGILPGTFPDLSSYVKQGGNVIITGQEDLGEFNLADLVLVNIRELKKEPTKACIKVTNEFTKHFENERCFATLTSFFDGTSRGGTKVIASANEVPLLAYLDLGKGKVFYYGIIDDTSDFKTLPSYPIFWNGLVNFMANMENIRDYNVKTGSTATIAEQQIKTPSSTISTSKILFDEAGYYEIASKKVASNLLNERESDVTKESAFKTDSENIEILKEHASKKELNLDVLVLIILFIVLMLELWYIKRRGDL